MQKSIYQQERVGKAVMQAALPAMLGQLTTLIYNMADTYFVALTRDAAQIAAVTLCAPVLLIIMSLSQVFGAGGSSMIARLIGAKEDQQVRAVASFCQYGMLIVGVVIALLCSLCAPLIVGTLGTDGQNAGFTADYLVWVFLGAPFIMFANGMLHILRAIGLIREGTFGLILGNAVNIALDYVFIVVLHMGTAGAAMATSLGFLVTTVYFLLVVGCQAKGGSEHLSLSPRYFRPTWRMAGEVSRVGVAGALITILLSVSNIVLNNFIGLYGTDAVAAYGIASKLDMVPVMLSVGLSQGVMPLIGYCCGAGDRPRLRKTMRISNVFGAVMGLCFTLLFCTLGTTLTGFFLEDAALRAMAARFLWMLGLSAPVVGVINLVTGYYQALGRPVPSLTITILRNVVLFIGAVMLLNRLWGLDGVIAAQPVVEAIMAMVCLGMYGREMAKGERN